MNLSSSENGLMILLRLVSFAVLYRRLSYRILIGEKERERVSLMRAFLFNGPSRPSVQVSIRQNSEMGDNEVSCLFEISLAFGASNND